MFNASLSFDAFYKVVSCMPVQTPTACSSQGIKQLFFAHIPHLILCALSGFFGVAELFAIKRLNTDIVKIIFITVMNIHSWCYTFV